MMAVVRGVSAVDAGAGLAFEMSASVHVLDVDNQLDNPMQRETCRQNNGILTGPQKSC